MAPKKNSNKENRGDSKLEAENIDTPDQVPQPDHRKKKQQRIPCQ